MRVASRNTGANPQETAVIRKLMSDGKNVLKGMKGIYALAPTGELLARCVGPHEDEIIKMLIEALERWEAMDNDERLLKEAPISQPGCGSFPGLYPTGGLVLQVFSRDLPREGEKVRGGNRDVAWFRKDEVRSMIPASTVPGTRQAVPEKLAHRLARFHLVDNVRGQRSEGIGFREPVVEKAELFFALEEVRNGRLHLEITGAMRTLVSVKTKSERGYAAQLHGRATYDPVHEMFVSFELVALGKRWGVRPARKGGPEPSGMGVAFRLVPDSEKPYRIPPAEVAREGKTYFAERR